MTKKWGDVNDGDEDEVKMPVDSGVQTFTTTGADGIKSVTEFRNDPNGKKIKVVRKFKETITKTRVHKSVLERRKWKKFGDVKGVPPGIEDNVTYATHERIQLDLRPRERGGDEEEDDELKKQLAGKTSVVVCRFCGEAGHFSLKCPKRDEIQAKAVKSAPDQGMNRRGGGGGDSGRYVPIHKRGDFKGGTGGGGPGGEERQEDYSIRVTNISEDTTEDDLRVLFRRFGHTTRTYLALDHVTRLSRGFAFVSYTRKEDAEMAIAKLNGHGYDNLILHVEFAKPRDPQPDKDKKEAGWTMRGTK